MAAIRSSSTKPEVLLRKALWHLGHRYRMNDKRLPGKPDIVLPKYRTAIFVHGCFWHGHRFCKNYSIPKTNTEFWTQKISRNQQRDQEVWRELEARGWFVIIIWECQLKKSIFDITLHNLEQEILRNGETFNKNTINRKKAREEHLLGRRARKEREALLLAKVKRDHPKKGQS